jgi:hypothetical protein
MRLGGLRQEVQPPRSYRDQRMPCRIKRAAMNERSSIEMNVLRSKLRNQCGSLPVSAKSRHKSLMMLVNASGNACGEIEDVYYVELISGK